MTPLNFIDWFVKLLSSNISSTFFVWNSVYRRFFFAQYFLNEIYVIKYISCWCDLIKNADVQFNVHVHNQINNTFELIFKKCYLTIIDFVLQNWGRIRWNKFWRWNTKESDLQRSSPRLGWQGDDVRDRRQKETKYTSVSGIAWCTTIRSKEKGPHAG